jgi:glycerol-3-phosphate acyltransferase PlsY
VREVLALAAAFALGSIPSAYVWVKIRTGRDIRTMGSGNVGATNVFRNLGRRDGALVLTADALKGMGAIYLGRFMLANGAIAGSIDPKLFEFAVGCAAILGHVFTPWLGFKGGKGVATGAGAALAIYPIPFFVAIVTWWLTLKYSGFMSVASIFAPYAFAASTALWVSDKRYAVVALVLALFITWTHRANIVRLSKGLEPKFTFKNK